MHFPVDLLIFEMVAVKALKNLSEWLQNPVDLLILYVVRSKSLSIDSAFSC